MVKKEHADGSVTQSQFDGWAGLRHRRMPQAGQQNTARCGDGPHHAHHHAGWQGIGVFYNHHSQLTSATGTDGLEIRRNMMNPAV